MRPLWGAYSSCSACIVTLQILVIAMLLLGLAGIGVIQVPGLSDTLFRVPEPRAPAATDRTFRAQPDAQAARQLGDRVRSALSQPGNLRLEVTEAELNAAMSAEAGQMGDLPVRDLYVQLDDNRMIVTGLLTEPFSTRIEIKARPQVENGRLKMRIEEAKAGAFPIPGFIAGQINAQVNDALEQAFINESMPFIETVKITQGKLEVTGRLRTDIQLPPAR
mgnify:CR=1 FL=1